MKILKITNDSPSERQVAETARDLAMGATAIIPTDTLYAIVGNALDMKPIEKICRLKGLNPDKTGLSILCTDISQAAEYARISDRAFSLMKSLTPGPYTFILPATRRLPKAFRGRKTVGIRIPDSNTAMRILHALGNPLLTTSIEYADEDYARNPELISEAYDGKVDIVVEGPDGDSTPSTIIDLTGDMPVAIRIGKGKWEE